MSSTGIEHYDPLDHAATRKRIEQGTIAEFQRVFPQTYGDVRLEADDVRLAGRDNLSIKEQKRALLTNAHPSRALKATLKLYDNNTDQLLDMKENFTLMRVPHYTDRGVFIYGGSDYTGVTQQRMIPGAYSRMQNNGGLETQFNVRPGTGKAFRVGIEPETGQLRLKIAGSNFHLYSLLNSIGVGDDVLEDAWGKGVLDLNKSKTDNRVFEKAYQKWVPSYLRAEDVDRMTKIAAIREALGKAQVAKKVVSRTLGGYWKDSDSWQALEKAAGTSALDLFLKHKAAAAAAAPRHGFDVRNQGDFDDEGDEYQPVGVNGILAASRKLLAINRGQDQVDNRDSPAFAKLFPVDRLLRERVRLDEGKLRSSMMRMLSYRKNLDSLHQRVFDPYYRDFITKDPRTTPPEEINPLALLEQHRRVTQRGPGGINSAEAISAENQNVQGGEFGFFSPLEGPECFLGDSEVYTDRGWVAWKDIGNDHRLMARIGRNPAFVFPNRLIHHMGSVEILYAWNDEIRMRITDAHRVIKGANHDKSYVLVPARALYGKEFETPLVEDTDDAMSVRWTRVTRWERHPFTTQNVYCAEVAGGILLVRDSPETLPYWSGNSSNAGIDVRMALDTRIGSDGRIRRPLLNARTGLMELVSPEDLADKVVRVPD